MLFFRTKIFRFSLFLDVITAIYQIDAVKNVGIKQLILPEENREDFEALDDLVKQGIAVHFVSQYDQIFPIIFPDFKPKTALVASTNKDENKNVD